MHLLNADASHPYSAGLWPDLSGRPALFAWPECASSRYVSAVLNQLTTFLQLAYACQQLI